MRINAVFAALVVASTVAATEQQPSRVESGATGRVVIHLTGLRSTKAPVRVAVFNAENSWLRDREAAYRTILDKDAEQSVWTIEKVPYADYAVAAFHDTNGNGELDRRIFGIPTEPYGFSNGARGVFGPASWQDAKVRVNGPVTEITIELK